MAPVLEGKSIGLYQKNRVLKGELMIWRTKKQARDQGIQSNPNSPDFGENFLIKILGFL